MLNTNDIGAADDLTEGSAISTVSLNASSVSVKIKEAGKGVQITDTAILSAFGDPVEDLHRGRPGAAEHQRGAEFGETPDQHDASARQDAGFKERQRDREKTAEKSCAHVSRRLVQCRIDVRQR